MSSNRHWRKTIFSALILLTFFINSIPVKTQDIIPSDDISGGSSVFVFRKSSKTQQPKFAARNFVARSQLQKAASRKSVREEIARVIRRPKSDKVDPNTVAFNQTKDGKTGKTVTDVTASKTLTKVQLSDQIAGFGEIYLDQKNYDEAIKAFRSALVHNPKNPKAKLGLSEALTVKGDDILEKSGAEASLNYYEEAKTVNPRNAAAFAGLGGAYEDLDKTDLALQNYAEAVKLNPELKELYSPLGAIYYQKGEIAKADEFLSKSAPNDQTQYLLGIIRYKQNRNEEAVAALQKSISLKPSAEAHYYLGEVYDRMNRPNESIAEYNTATGMNPRYAEAWFDLGAAYYNRGRYEDSVAAYEKAVLLKNDNPEAFENLGDAYRQLKKYKEAEGRYNQAIGFIDRTDRKSKDPKGVAELYSKQGFVQGRLSRWGAAINSLESAVKNSPDAYDYTNLGWAYYNAAELDKATKRPADAKAKLLQGKDALQKAVNMNVNNAGTYMNLGLTQNELGEYKDAVDSFNKCLQLRNNWVAALNELGFAHRYLNQLDEAVSNFRRATELDKKYYPAFYNLAEAEFRRGNVKEAKKTQEALRKIDPNSRYIQNLSKRLDVMFMGGVLTNPTKELENKAKSKIPKIPY